MIVQSISVQQPNNSSLELTAWLCYQFSKKVRSRTLKLFLLGFFFLLIFKVNFSFACQGSFYTLFIVFMCCLGSLLIQIIF